MVCMGGDSGGDDRVGGDDGGDDRMGGDDGGMTGYEGKMEG